MDELEEKESGVKEQIAVTGKKSKPKSSIKEGEGAVVSTIALSGRLDEAEKRLNLMDKSIEFVTSTNKFILIILFMGLVAIIISFMAGVIQAITVNTSTQIEFIKAVQRLDDKIITPTPIPTFMPTPTPTIQ